MEHRNFTSVKTKQQLLIIFPESLSFSLISLSEFIFPDFQVHCQVARHPERHQQPRNEYGGIICRQTILATQINTRQVKIAKNYDLLISTKI